MTDLRKASEMALEAMERRNSVNYEYKVYLQDAIDVLRQALAQPEQTRRVCNTCDGTGMAKGLHNWKGGGKRDQPCWACHEVADEKKEPALGDADPRLLLGRSNNFTKEIENRLCDIERRLAAADTQPALAQHEHPLDIYERAYFAGKQDGIDETIALLKVKNK